MNSCDVSTCEWRRRLRSSPSFRTFFRKRAELELDYSKSLDKMAKSIQLRHKEQKQKREQWPLFSSFSCWQQLVNETKSLSRDHAALSEVYSTHLVSRLNQVMEDVQRIYRRCREIGYETHEEILRVLHELHTTMKTYQAYQAESRQAETKLRVAEQQRTKLEVANAPPEKLARSKKYKLIEKEVNKRKSKYTEAKLKALKARNEYILCLEASNTTIHKYFVDDLSDLIDCMDFGFHNCISRALMMHCSAEEGRQRSLQSGVDQLTSCINALDSRADKQRFLESHHAAFMIPKKFEFQGQRGDDVPESELQKVLHTEMEQRLQQLQQRVTTLKTESEEVWKTLETAEKSLLEMLSVKDYDCTKYFGDNAVPTSKPPETVQIKLRADRQETEEFYLSKFREYLLGTSRIARLDAKQDHIRQCLLEGSNSSPNPSITANRQKQPRRRRIGRLQMNGQPKLFGGSLEEYLESTNLEIPLIMKSCIRVINLYGLHHQGIFRVSGSQVEINNFREWFERGEDPLADMTDASDINSVAGVLKLYLRELREPIFPIIYFEQLMELAQLDSKQEFIARMKQVISSLPRPVVIVMRYLFAFLNHLSEFSDENMMDPYNLAICFGPTLVPVPEDKDQVQYQNQVNELIKNIIVFCEEIFPDDIGGIQYEKYISREPDDADVGDSPTDQVQEDMDSEVYPSEDESENLEAVAQFDFIARSERELSFKKGDTLTLYTQVSNDWWRGALGGREGLIPDKYILLKIKDEERDKDLKSSSSEESMRRRASSSADSVLSSNNSPLMGPSNNSNIWPSVVACEAAMTANMMQSSSSSTSSILPSSVSSIPCVSSSQPIISREEAASTPTNRTKDCTPDKESNGPSLSNGSHDDPSLLSTDSNCSSSDTVDSSLKQPQDFVDTSNASDDLSTDSRRGAARKHHWKSQSVGETSANNSNSSNNTSNHSEDDSDQQLGGSSFSANRELWQRRAASHSQLQLTSPAGPKFVREMRQKHTPDLVMDLPLVSGESASKSASSGSLSPCSVVGAGDINSDDEDGLLCSTPARRSTLAPSTPAIGKAIGPESPDMSTAAERFAKQNQCTLKKKSDRPSLVRLDADLTPGAAGTPTTTEENGSIVAGGEIVRSASSHQVGGAPPPPARSTPMIAAKFADMHLTGGSQATPPFKPPASVPIKIKPSVGRKPVLPYPHPGHMSPELARKIDKQAQNSAAAADQAN